MKAYPKKILSVILCVLSVLLCSCADMGEGLEQDSFKNYFSNVILLSHEGRSERSITAFNGEISLENSTEIKDVIDCSDYCYIAFEVADGYVLKVDEFAFFARTEDVAGVLELEFYVTDELPTKIEGGESDVYFPDSSGEDNSVYLPETDATSGEIVEREDGERSDADIFKAEDKYHSESMRVSAEWDSVLLEFDTPQTVKAGEYIVIRISNNCLAVGERENERISFTINYLMFHFTQAEKS